MIICTGENILRSYKDCSEWEKKCLKERLWQGCDYTYDLDEETRSRIESFDCSSDIPNEICEKAFESVLWSDEDFLR